MKLLSLTTTSIRGLPDRTYRFVDRRNGDPLETALVTGAPATGKTTLLEAIASVKEAVGSYGGPQAPARLLRQGTTHARIDVLWAVSGVEQASADLPSPELAATWTLGEAVSRIECEPRARRLFSAYSHDPAQGKFEYFPANRRIPQGRSSSATTAPTPAAEARLRLTDDPDKYASLRSHLHEVAIAEALRVAHVLQTQGVALRTQQGDGLAPYKDAIAAVLPDLRLLAVEPQDRLVRILFQKRDGRVLELAELAESERQGVLFALTFRRLGLSRSVVLIDVPELHLHPSHHADFFAAVCGLGRDNQIIAATTSPHLLTAARAEQVIDLDSPPRA